MRAVIQRVTSARVRVADHVVGEIARGLLVLAGIENATDGGHQTFRQSHDLRIFEAQQKMNLSLRKFAWRCLRSHLPCAPLRRPRPRLRG